MFKNIFQKSKLPFKTIKNALKKKNSRLVQTDYSTKSAIERITDSVINETCAPDGKLHEDFLRLTKSYNRDTNPINADIAEDIIKALIISAMARRNNIATRIEEACKSDELIHQYNEKMHAIEDQQAKLSGIKKFAENAEEELRREKQHYNNISKGQYKEPKKDKKSN